MFFVHHSQSFFRKKGILLKTYRSLPTIRKIIYFFKKDLKNNFFYDIILGSEKQMIHKFAPSNTRKRHDLVTKSSPRSLEALHFFGILSAEFSEAGRQFSIKIPKPKFNTERYRSGHNGADSKSVCAQAHEGSNPSLSAKNSRVKFIREFLHFSTQQPLYSITSKFNH